MPALWEVLTILLKLFLPQFVVAILTPCIHSLFNGYLDNMSKSAFVCLIFACALAATAAGALGEASSAGSTKLALPPFQYVLSCVRLGILKLYHVILTSFALSAAAILLEALERRHPS